MKRPAGAPPTPAHRRRVHARVYPYEEGTCVTFPYGVDIVEKALESLSVEWSRERIGSSLFVLPLKKARVRTRGGLPSLPDRLEIMAKTRAMSHDMSLARTDGYTMAYAVLSREQ